jgi:hypothetical protein
MSESEPKNLVRANFHPLMYYHTSLRNVGLYTSIAFAGLAFASRQNDKKNRVAFMFGLLLVLCFLLIGASINMHQLSLLNEVSKSTPELDRLLRPLITISTILIPVHIIMIIFTTTKMLNLV